MEAASCSRRSKRLQNKLQKKTMSGTCNVCSAPCSSCMHHNPTGSVMESNNDDVFAEEASFTNVGVQNIGKGRPDEERKCAASETSNLFNASLSHDSFSENAQRKSTRQKDDPSYDDVEKPIKEPSDGAVRVNDSLKKPSMHSTERDPASHSSITDLSNRMISIQDSEHSRVEQLGDNLSCVSGSENKNSGANDLNMESDRQNATKDDSSSPMETDQGDCEPAVRVAASTAEVSEDVDAKEGLCSGDTSLTVALVSSQKPISDTSKESNIASVEMLKSEKIEKEKEKLVAVLDDSEVAGSSLQAPQVAGSENDNSDLLEDDVKVCDICGDAGREDKLAVCSRCSDGAEHIYCMRIMLNKIPEGDWLCEECQFKVKEEADKKKQTASENLPGMSKLPSFNKKSQDIGSTSKVLPYSDVPATRTVENVDASSRPNRKVPETNDPNLSRISISNPKNILVREASFKNLDASKPKLSNSGNQTVTSFPSMLVRASVGPGMPKSQPRMQSPRGPLNSFSGKAKVQQATDKTSQKTKPDGDSDARKEHGSVLGRSGSFKSTTIGLSNTDLVPKHQATKRVDDIVSSILDKQRSLLERSSANASPTASACNPYSNSDKKMPHHETHISDKGSEDLRGGANEMKQQSCLSKSVHFALTERPSPLDSKPSDVAIKEDLKSLGSKSGDIWCDPSVQRGRDGKSKETFSGSRPVVSSTVRVPRCQKCNEMGHPTHLCSIDKLRFSALKPYPERNPKDVPNKSNKWKDAVEAAVSKNNRIHKSRMPEQPNEMPRLGSGSGCGVSSKPQLSDAFSFAGIPSAPEGTSNVQDSLRSSTLASTTFVRDMVPQKHSIEEITCSSSTSDGVDLAAVSRSNSNFKLSPELVFSLVNSSGALAVPELDYIWKGAFTIQSAEKFSELCDVQAHLSTRASRSVVKVMEHFPNKVELTEMPCASIWPSQFHKKSPTEENIALFFFATSTESYEKGYKKLLENMLKNDSILSGSINGVDLLIIPSNKLPERSQRWNRLFFLWGVFRLKNPASESVSNFSSKLSDDKLSAENSNQQLLCTIASQVVSEKEQSGGPRDKELPAIVKQGIIDGYSGNLQDGSICINKLPVTDQSNSSHADFKDWKKTIGKTRLPNEVVSTGVSHAEGMDSFLTEPVRQEDNIGKQLMVIGPGKDETSPMDVAVSRSVEFSGVSTQPSQPSSFGLGVNQKEVSDEQTLEAESRSLTGVVASLSQDISKGDQDANLKRSYSNSIDLESNPDLVWEKRDNLPFNGEREAKRIRLCTDMLAKDDILGVMTSKSSSKIHPILGSFINEDAQRAVRADDQTLPECSTSSEKVFFPVNSGHVELKPVDFVPVVVAPDEPDVPNLELALGAEKKPKKGLIPLLFSLTNPQSQEVKPPDPVDMEEDPSQSLSLSLAMPSPPKGQPAK